MPDRHNMLIDTNVLLEHYDTLFDDLDSKIIIHSIVCEELDNIIHNSLSEEKKYKARQARNSIKENSNKIYSTHSPTFSFPVGWDYNKNDNSLLGVCKDLKYTLITNDLAMQIKADSIGVQWKDYNKNKCDDIYTGYKEVVLDEYDLALHYQCSVNKWGLLNNEYLILKDGNGDIVDRQRWTDNKGFVPISTKPLKSVYLGDIRPRDVYQMIAIDSLYNTDFTLLFGMAGTAKTLLSLGYIMFNPVKLKNNEQLGYYSGDRTQKLLQNSIGGILSSKLGDMTVVESLINQGKIIVMPTSDIRGVEVVEGDCIYVTEAQNTDAYTMRTIIQMAEEGCKIIVEGDLLEQQDIRNCSQKENSMMRIIDVFKGSKYFSCVKLKHIYRSPIAEIAQNI